MNSLGTTIRPIVNTFRHPELAVIVTFAAALVFVLLVQHKSGIDRVAYDLAVGLASVYITGAAAGFRYMAKNVSVLMFVLGFSLWISAMLFTDAASFKSSIVESSVPQMLGITAALIMTAIQRNGKVVNDDD